MIEKKVEVRIFLSITLSNSLPSDISSIGSYVTDEGYYKLPFFWSIRASGIRYLVFATTRIYITSFSLVHTPLMILCCDHFLLLSPSAPPLAVQILRYLNDW